MASVYEYTRCTCMRVHRCAVYMRAWVCTCALFLMEQVEKRLCPCSPGEVGKRVPCAVRDQVQWCAGAGSHQPTSAESTHLFPTLCSVSHVGSLKLAMVGALIPWKSGLFNHESRWFMLISTPLARVIPPETQAHSSSSSS